MPEKRKDAPSSPQETRKRKFVHPISLQRLPPTVPSLEVNELRDGLFRRRFLPTDDPLLHPPRLSGKIPINIRLVRSSGLSIEELSTCFELLKQTSAADYDKSSVGWKEGRKKKEMTDKDQWYLLVTRAEDSNEEDAGSDYTLSPDEVARRATLANHHAAAYARQQPLPLGFLAFRLLIDDESPGYEPVLYIYEIHLSTALRNQGLGSHLLHIADVVAARTGMEKVMLTVFTRNKKARRLYERCGFRKDASSPADRVFRNRIHRADYWILFKPVRAVEHRDKRVKDGDKPIEHGQNRVGDGGKTVDDVEKPVKNGQHRVGDGKKTANGDEKPAGEKAAKPAEGGDVKPADEEQEIADGRKAEAVQQIEGGQK